MFSNLLIFWNSSLPCNSNSRNSSSLKKNSLLICYFLLNSSLWNSNYIKNFPWKSSFWDSSYMVNSSFTNLSFKKVINFNYFINSGRFIHNLPKSNTSPFWPHLRGLLWAFYLLIWKLQKAMYVGRAPINYRFWAW